MGGIEWRAFYPVSGRALGRKRFRPLRRPLNRVRPLTEGQGRPQRPLMTANGHNLTFRDVNPPGSRHVSDRLDIMFRLLIAGVAELADAADSKSAGRKGLGGSSPPSGIGDERREGTS